LSALKFTDKLVEKVEDILTWYTHPIFEKSDIECVVFALRAQHNPIAWLKYRAVLFQNPDIVTFTQSVLNGIKEEEKSKRA